MSWMLAARAQELGRMQGALVAFAEHRLDAARDLGHEKSLLPAATLALLR